MIFFMAKGFRGFVKIIRQQSQDNNKALSFWSIILFFLGLSFWQIFIVEFVHRGSPIAMFLWFVHNPLIFMLNYLLTALVCLFFITISGSLRQGVIFSTICLLMLSIINAVKKQFLGDPLFPWDFKRIDQVFVLLPSYVEEISIILVGLCFFIIGFSLIAKVVVPSYSLSWLSRIALFIGIVMIVPALLLNGSPLQAVISQKTTDNMARTQTHNSLKNGFLLGYTMNLAKGGLIQPPAYNQETIQRIMRENNPSYSSGSTKKDQEDRIIKPNIIVVLNEAFWDPTNLPGINFSEDPIPNFRYLAQQYSSGSLISPVFGGSTANVEFEILTGLSVKYLPPGVIAYQQYLKQPMPSLAHAFKDNGYRVMAIHPYHAWFYNRKQVYSLLGFESAKFLEDFIRPEKRAGYISDLEVSKKIIEQVEQSENPGFIFAVTMQNHAPYSAKRYSNRAIEISGDLESNSRDILRTYAQGLRESDQSLKYLIDYFSQADEPTMICFFGDHLPYLGKDYLVYQQTGYIPTDENNWTMEDHLNMKTVPFIIWTNYNTRSEKNMRLSMSVLGSYLLDLAGIEPPPVFRVTRNMAGRLSVYDKTVNIGNESQLLPQLPDDLAALEEDYRLLQYDLLLGKQYYNNTAN